MVIGIIAYFWNQNFTTNNGVYSRYHCTCIGRFSSDLCDSPLVAEAAGCCHAGSGDPNYQVPYPTTLSDLIAEAQKLAQDGDAVAVGKLQAAIATAQTVANPTDAA